MDNLLSHLLWILLGITNSPKIDLSKIENVSIKQSPLTAEDILAQKKLEKDSLLQTINIIRTQNNLRPLKGSSQLNQSALEKALDLVNQNYWAHQNPQGIQPWDLMKQAGYDYKSAGENLERDYTDEAKTIETWMNSPTHKENILNPNYRELGIGRNTPYVVTHFGKPKAITIKTLDL